MRIALCAFFDALPKKVARAAALAVALDVRYFPFWDEHFGMSNFAQTLFELGQTLPVNEKVGTASYLPGKTTDHSAVHCTFYKHSSSDPHRDSVRKN